MGLRPAHGHSPRRRSASCSTRCCTPMVSLLPADGAYPAVAALPLRDSGRDCSSGGRRSGIFPLLGRTRWSPQGPSPVCRALGKGGVGERHVQQVGLPAQLGRGMRVGIGDEHGNRPAQKAASSWAGPKKGRFPGRGYGASGPRSTPQWCRSPENAPNREKCGVQMCAGMKTASGQASKRDFQQVAAVQAQNGPPVRMDVADCLQLVGERLRRLQAGKQDDVVHLADPAVLFVNGADFARSPQSADAVARPCRRPCRRYSSRRV